MWTLIKIAWRNLFRQRRRTAITASAMALSLIIAIPYYGLTEGLSAETIKAMGVASGAYETALNRSETAQGEAAVYIRVLRQLGEIYAAKQRLGVEPEIDVPFSIEQATEIYAAFHTDLDAGWEKHGYRDSGRGDYLAAMHRL